MGRLLLMMLLEPHGKTQNQENLLLGWFFLSHRANNSLELHPFDL